jgi:hypothetical protein
MRSRDCQCGGFAFFIFPRFCVGKGKGIRDEALYIFYIDRFDDPACLPVHFHCIEIAQIFWF